MKLPLLFALSLLLAAAEARAFCGFYVAKADTSLFNKASKVVLARDGDATNLTMVNDYQGDPKEFAVVVPVPVVIKKDQVKVIDKAVVDHLDAYSAPRLVEYFDDDPCRPPMPTAAYAAEGSARTLNRPSGSKSLGVKIEAQYTVGEYDIVVLSAEQSDGLETWLTQSGYKIPKGAGDVLESYIKQNVKFFVAKVNLAEKAKSGFTFLRPLQVTFTSPKFMLPIRLGTVNADGPQELFIFALTRKGRVEATNYRTVKLPSDAEIPLFVKDDFGRFYRDLFSQAVKRENMKVLFTEYAWDMGWCDPCAADPLSAGELRQLGVSWLQEPNVNQPRETQVYLTRLHVRYDREHFPEDLVFQETGDNSTFQGRYIMRHPWTGGGDCRQAEEYRRELPKRQDKEGQTLARLTGWSIDEIRKKISSYKDTARGPGGGQ